MAKIKKIVSISIEKPDSNDSIISAVNTNVYWEPSNTNTVTWSHTISDVPNRLLVVYIPISQTPSISTVTYNGVSMESIIGVGATSGDGKAYMFYMVNPPVGTANCVATYNSSIAWLAGMSALFSGVDLEIPILNKTSASVTAGNKSFDAVCKYSNSYILECYGDSGSTTTPSSGQVALATGNRVASYDPIVVLGNNAQTWSSNMTMPGAWVGCELSAAGIRTKNIMGKSKSSIKTILGVSIL